MSERHRVLDALAGALARERRHRCHPLGAGFREIAASLLAAAGTGQATPPTTEERREQTELMRRTLLQP